MRIGLFLGYSGRRLPDHVPLVQEADRLGFDSVWVAEAYGSDAVTVLTWLAAHTDRIRVGSGVLQMPARTPAMAAMTAVTLDELSGGRFRLGLGVSGPQVVEGWHGIAYGRPLQRTREYVTVIRRIIARDEPVTFAGTHYRIPYDGADATGLGKPLRITLHPGGEIPIYVAAIGPRNVQLTAEIADGWLPMFYSPYRASAVWGEALTAGFAASGDEGKEARFDVAPSVPVVLGDDLEAAWASIKPMVALYVGGMGARGKNFYNSLACRYGYEAAAATIQDLYLSGDRAAAVAAVPDELVDEISLVGPRERIRDRLAAWEDAGVGTLLASVGDIGTLAALAEFVG